MSIGCELKNVLEDQPSDGRIAILSYCFAQQMVLEEDRLKGDSELKKDLLMLPAPFDNYFLEQALTVDLCNLDLWVEHLYEMYDKFFCKSEQLEQYFLWVAFRNYDRMRRFIKREESEGNSIIADHHRNDTMPAFAKLIQTVGKKVLSKEYLQEVFEEESNDVAWCEMMKRLIAELKLA